MIVRGEIQVPVLNRMVESLIGTQANAFDNGNANINNIFGNFKQEGILDDIKSDVMLHSVDGVDDFFAKMGGVSNVVKSLMSVVYNSLEKTADENT